MPPEPAVELLLNRYHRRGLGFLATSRGAELERRPRLAKAKTHPVKIRSDGAPAQPFDTVGRAGRLSFVVNCHCFRSTTLACDLINGYLAAGTAKLMASRSAGTAAPVRSFLNRVRSKMLMFEITTFSRVCHMPCCAFELDHKRVLLMPFVIRKFSADA